MPRTMIAVPAADSLASPLTDRLSNHRVSLAGLLGEACLNGGRRKREPHDIPLEKMNRPANAVCRPRDFADEQTFADSRQTGEEDHALGTRQRLQKSLEVALGRDNDNLGCARHAVFALGS